MANLVNPFRVGDIIGWTPQHWQGLEYHVARYEVVEIVTAEVVRIKVLVPLHPAKTSSEKVEMMGTGDKILIERRKTPISEIKLTVDTTELQRIVNDMLQKTLDIEKGGLVSLLEDAKKEGNWAAVEFLAKKLKELTDLMDKYEV